MTFAGDEALAAKEFVNNDEVRTIPKEIKITSLSFIFHSTLCFKEIDLRGSAAKRNVGRNLTSKDP